MNMICIILPFIQSYWRGNGVSKKGNENQHIYALTSLPKRALQIGNKQLEHAFEWGAASLKDYNAANGIFHFTSKSRRCLCLSMLQILLQTHYIDYHENWFASDVIFHHSSLLYAALKAARHWKLFSISYLKSSFLFQEVHNEIFQILSFYYLPIERHCTRLASLSSWFVLVSFSFFFPRASVPQIMMIKAFHSLQSVQHEAKWIPLFKP